MSQVQKVRRRIRSVKNIKQITSAMEMVAASKLKKAQASTLASRTYTASAREVLSHLSDNLRASQAFTENPFFQSAQVGQRLLIVFTSDRGLSGSYNGNVLKAVARLLFEETGIEIVMIGNKGAQFLRRLNGGFSLQGLYVNWPYCPSLSDVAPIAKTALDLFTAREVTRVSVLYTNHISVGRHEVVLEDILPLPAQDVVRGDVVEKDTLLFEPSASQVLEYVVPRLCTVQVYQAALEAAASEQAARMMAMKNATDNAGDLVEDLTLEYNSARQAVVTAELAEISGGAAALA